MKVKTPASVFAFPKLELPKFDSKYELPPAFKKFAEKSLTQAREACEEIKAAAEEVSDLFEDTYAVTANGITNYNLKLVEAMRMNTSATLEYARKLLEVTSISELLELTSCHACEQLEVLSEQSKELAKLAHKLTTESADAIKSSAPASRNVA